VKKKIISFVIISVGLLALLLSVFFYPSKEESKNQTVKSVVKVKKATTSILLPHDSTSLECLKGAIETLAHSDSLQHGTFGFCLSSDSGNILVEYNSNQSLVPASALKTVTTGICLNKLGPGFRYSTRLQYDGVIDKFDKTLEGNLYIKGSGDPTLGSSVFNGCDEESILANWITAIKNLGIDSIKGAVIGDADVFDDDIIPAGWAWEDMQSDYGIGPCGLSFHENVYDIKVDGNSVKPKFSVVQPIPELKLINYIGVNNSTLKDYVYASGGPYSNERYLKGAVKAGNYTFIGQSAIPDPAYYCAHALYLKLKKNGIPVRDSATTTRKLRIRDKKIKKDRTSFYTTSSPTLSSIIWYTNTVSQNFYAENLLRSLSLYQKGYGSTPGGVNVVKDYCEENNIDTRGFFMVDGSGVSRFDAVTARQLVNVLQSYTKDSILFNVFYNTLPVAGDPGELSEICKGSLVEKNIRCKGGYMSRVLSFAGYVTTKSGKRLTFAMLANNYEYSVIGMRNELEKLMVLLSELE